MLPQQIVWIAIFLELLGSFWYIKEIIYGDTRPNLVSWSLWLLGPFLGFFFQIKAGATASAWPIFMAGFGPLLVVIVALILKKSYWKLRIFDIVCGMFSVFALMLYILTHNLAASIVFAILSDFLAFVPTYLKGWRFPETESIFASVCYAVANVFGLLIIEQWTFTIYSFGLYLILANVAMILILYRKKLAILGFKT